MFWKIYFFFLLFDLLISPFSYTFQFWEIVYSPIFIISLFGLYLFCWNKKKLPQTFWEIFLPIFVVSTLAFSYFIPTPQEIQADIGEISPMTNLIFSLVFYAPIFLALYLYAFKNLNNQKTKGLFRKKFPKKNRIETSTRKKTKQVLWKIYYTLYAINIFGYIFFDYKKIIGWVDLIMFTITALGLYSYIWKKEVFTQTFWKLYFASSILWLLASPLTMSTNRVDPNPTNAKMLLIIVVFLIIITPQYRALYMYAFKSKDIWNNDNNIKMSK